MKRLCMQAIAPCIINRCAGFEPLFKRGLVALALLLAAGWAQAQATVYTATMPGGYTFTGDFTAPCITGPCANFDLAMGISGSFTTPAPLAANLNGADIFASVTAFNFTSGLNTFSSTDPKVRTHLFRVSTDGSGAIIDSNIVLLYWETGTSPHAIDDRVSHLETGFVYANHNERCSTVGDAPTGVGDSCLISDFDSDSSTASGVALVWSSAAVPAGVASIPTLSEWGLTIMAFLLGLAGLAAMRSRRIQSH